jgi:hypothetical protein
MGLSNFPNGITSFGNIVAGGIGVGNVYYVCNTTSTSAYADLVTKFANQTYSDGSAILYPHTASASAVTTNGLKNALAATVEDRNDYVIVVGANNTYYIDEALAMNKKNVHLVCPAGLGNEIGATNAARIQQITASTAIIAVSDSSIEIAGFYLKNINATAAITIANGSYAMNIHHNTFPLIWTSGAQTGSIVCSGDGGAWGSIERNWFVSQSGGACTCASGVIQVQAAATACRVKHNEITIGDTQIATIGISNAAVKGHTDFNIFSESGGSGVADGGTITNCISINTSGAAIGNLCAVATGHFATGGTASISFCENYDGVENVTLSGSVQS